MYNNDRAFFSTKKLLLKYKVNSQCIKFNSIFKSQKKSS